MAELKLLIGGALVAGDRTMEVINPATGEAFLTVPRASVAQADAAIAAAKAAQPAWGATPLATRQQALLDLADAIGARIESGQVWVNQHLAIGPHIPMAGFKQSGLGVEQGVEGLAEYAQVQVVNIKR